MDRRARLELALELLNAARDLGSVASALRGKRAGVVREWTDKLSARGLSLLADDIGALLQSGEAS